MKLGLGFPHAFLTTENLRYASQLGVTHVIVHTPRIGNDGVLDYDAIAKMRESVESFGLQIEAFENLPGDHTDKIVYGQPGREEQMEKVGQTIKNMGRAGIPILGYVFGIHKGSGHWRAYDAGGGRGNCAVKSFDVDMPAAMRVYKEVGYDGVLIPDHCPVIQDDKGFRHRGMAFSLGYMRALMQAVEGGDGRME